MENWLGAAKSRTTAMVHGVQIGDKVTCSHWQWVQVITSDPRPGRNTENAGVDYGGVLVVVGVDEDKVLCCYSGHGNDGGTNCAQGSVVLLKASEFINMAGKFELAQEKFELERASIKRMLLGWVGKTRTALLEGNNERLVELEGRERHMVPHRPRHGRN